MVLQIVCDRISKREGKPSKKLHICLDSQSAIGMLTLGWEPNAHKSTIMEVRHLQIEPD